MYSGKSSMLACPWMLSSCGASFSRLALRLISLTCLTVMSGVTWASSSGGMLSISIKHPCEYASYFSAISMLSPRSENFLLIFMNRFAMEYSMCSSFSKYSSRLLKYAVHNCLSVICLNIYPSRTASFADLRIAFFISLSKVSNSLLLISVYISHPAFPGSFLRLPLPLPTPFQIS